MHFMHRMHVMYAMHDMEVMHAGPTTRTGVGRATAAKRRLLVPTSNSWHDETTATRPSPVRLDYGQASHVAAGTRRGRCLREAAGTRQQ